MKSLKKLLNCDIPSDELKRHMEKMKEIEQKMWSKQINPSLKQKWIKAVHRWEWWLCVTILIIIIFFMDKI